MAFATAEEAKFLRGINLNGPALEIDGHQWEAEQGAKDFVGAGNRFANQNVKLKPTTDEKRAEMIRSSVYSDNLELSLTGLTEGDYQVTLYVWEDNHSEQFGVAVNGKVVLPAFNSGSEGMWKRLGPWRTRTAEGKITLKAFAQKGGAANLSGIELWSGDGEVPGLPGASFVTTPTPEQVEFFEKRIRPVFATQCAECHSATAKVLRGGLLLDSRAGIQRGGDSGPLLTPGDPESSRLIEAIKRQNPNLQMPPKSALAPEVIADFEQWIRMGAPDPRTESTLAAAQPKERIDWTEAKDWWAFRPLSKATPPEVRNSAWPRGEIDRFVLAKMEAQGLSPAPPAQKRTLLRRATYDLTGLPPTPEELREFLADESPEAFSKVVDRLLASPRYGERWGRHWLDVVRYADTAGDNSDFPIPQMYRYRNWVINAINRDLPYDQFVREQLAGDLLGGKTKEERFDRIIATGYIANARRFGSRVHDYPQHLTIEDTLDNLGRAFLGLSLSCARCHDHKFDPIPTRDYYALYGIFNSTRYPWPGIELEQKQRDLVPLATPEELATAEQSRKAYEEKMGELGKIAKELRDKKAPENEIKAAEKKLADHAAKKPKYELVYAVAEHPSREDAVIQLKGDPAKPGETVPRGFLTVLGGQTLPRDDKSSGRLALAEWLLGEDNPLTPRVMANRLWHYHFGTGIVPTPNDFGKQGKPPTHPELLDFLARKFREGGWSLKAMHRLIMLSATYQMSSERSPEAVSSDPTNQWLSSFPRRRIDAESLRDTLLAVGGNLDLKPGGEHPFPTQDKWQFTQHNPFKAVYDHNQRSVYLMTQRIQRHPFLALFDGADPSTSTPARTSSTTPVQSLYFLNDPFVHEQANRVAERLLKSDGDDAAKIQRGYEWLIARPADDEESALALAYLGKARARLQEEGVKPQDLEIAAWQSLVRAWFRLNEFLYCD